MQTDYTLSWVLPFVRESLRGRGNFSFDEFMDSLWQVFENTSLLGIFRHQTNFGQTYDMSKSPATMRFAAQEAFFYLIQNGFVLPGAPSNMAANSGFTPLGRFSMTARGVEWAAGTEPLPEDLRGYMNLVRNLVPNVDPVIAEYVSQGLDAFGRGALFAAAVMIGAAAEKAVYLLAESMVDALKEPTRQARLQKLLAERKLMSLFRFVEHTIDDASTRKTIPYSVTEGSSPHLMSLIEAIRVQRNDAVHPMVAQVSPVSVRHSFNAFPHAFEKLEALRAWLRANPQSI
jgi:hypothetical protein